MNLILLGAPGAGKGTLASYLIEQMGVPSISTGNILREAIKNNTPLGQSAKEYMDAGKLVPDEVVIGMLKERIAKARLQERFHPRRFSAYDSAGGSTRRDCSHRLRSVP